MFLWKCAKLFFKKKSFLTSWQPKNWQNTIAGSCRFRLQRPILIMDRHTSHFQTGKKPRGQIREAGWSCFTHMTACRRSLPLSFGRFLQAVARCFPSQRVGENLQEEHEMKRQVRAAAAWPGMTAQECAVRRCGGPATFTHTRGRIDRELDRTGVDNHRLNWRFVCRLLTIRKMELFTSWVARAWIMCAFVTFYAQVKTLAA